MPVEAVHAPESGQKGREGVHKEVEIRTVCDDKAAFDNLVAEAKKNGVESRAITIEEKRFKVEGFPDTLRIRKICDDQGECKFTWTIKTKGSGSDTVGAKVRDEKDEYEVDTYAEALAALLAAMTERMGRTVTESDLVTDITSVRTRTIVECGAGTCTGVTISADTFTTVDDVARVPPFYSVEFELVLLSPNPSQEELDAAAGRLKKCAEDLGAKNFTVDSVTKLLRGKGEIMPLGST
jgi:hypothetical protein